LTNDYQPSLPANDANSLLLPFTEHPAGSYISVVGRATVFILVQQV